MYPCYLYGTMPLGDHTGIAKYSQPVPVLRLCSEGLLVGRCGETGHCPGCQWAAVPPTVEQLVPAHEGRYCNEGRGKDGMGGAGEGRGGEG